MVELCAAAVSAILFPTKLQLSLMGILRMKRLLTAVSILALALPVLAQQAPKPTSEADIAEIIRRFASAESENRTARNEYTFTQDVDIQTIGEAGSVSGRYRRVSEIVYDDRGVRFEKITFFPPSSLYGLGITNEDLQDLAGVQPFALTSEDLSKYIVTYAGKEKIDELNTYYFDVKPKQILKGERYLEGRIWVDDQDLQIVKVAGKAVPEVKDQKFPKFESYRENIDGRYWFPTYVYVDDTLDFRKGGSIHGCARRLRR